MSRNITSEDLIELLIKESGGSIKQLDEAAFIRVAERINHEYVNGFNPVLTHKGRGSDYEVVGRGLLQLATEHVFVEGDEIVAYRDEGKRMWFRYGPEMDDGRFKKKE